MMPFSPDEAVQPALPGAKPFNLSDWALAHRSLVWYFMIVFALLGSSPISAWGARRTPTSRSRP